MRLPSSVKATSVTTGLSDKVEGGDLSASTLWGINIPRQARLTAIVLIHRLHCIILNSIAKNTNNVVLTTLAIEIQSTENT